MMGVNLLQFKHFSPKPGLTVLDPRYFGTAKAGRERLRASVPSICLYALDGEPERIFSGCHEYRVTIDESALYNLSADPLNLLRHSDFSKVERCIKRRGFLGYWLPEAVGLFRGQARIFRRVPCQMKSSG